VHRCERESSGSQRQRLDIADIIRVHVEALQKLYPLTAEQTAALRDIERCRTAALGGHLDKCKTCGWSQPSYNSCRNRSCPKCQALRQAVWIESRVARTLATHHFHAVFTLPAELRPLAQLHPAFVYKQLFDCASATLMELGRDPKRLGAELGITIVLHTWARNLSLHPHVHCIVTGGGLTADGCEWKHARPDFLFPVAVMRKLFRGKLLDAVAKANAAGKLNRSDGNPWLGPTELRRMIRKLRRLKWVVYCKRPFGGPTQVIGYLGQYTHRVAISNSRLVSIDHHAVTLRTRDGGTCTLEPVEFLRRFVTHVLPPRFVKIRHYGLMATGNAKKRWQQAAELLGPAQPCPDEPDDDTSTSSSQDDDWQSVLHELTGIDVRRCPQCGEMTVEREPLPDTRAPPLAEAA